MKDGSALHPLDGRMNLITKIKSTVSTHLGFSLGDQETNKSFHFQHCGPALHSLRTRGHKICLIRTSGTLPQSGTSLSEIWVWHTKVLSLLGSQEDRNAQKKNCKRAERDRSALLRICDKICPRGEMNDTSLTKPSYPQRHADILSLNMSVDMERSCFNQGTETHMKNSRNYDKGE